jgi:beta-N-acetylhexosaminidase
MSSPRPFPAIDPQSAWVKQTLGSLSLEEMVGQMLHPYVRPHESAAAIAAGLPPVRLGGAFLFTGNTEEYLRTIGFLQIESGKGGGAADALPIAVSSDLESGAGRMIRDSVLFPDLMALAAGGAGAAGQDLAAAMGEATAREARARGVHWCLGPVVDINANPRNPITNTRSLGDDRDLVASLGAVLVTSMQRCGLCATPKHFPGDGWDDRDQHLCTSVNPLSRNDWFAESAVPFRRAIDAGAWSVMLGHIALPWADPGRPGDWAGAPPALLSRAIATDLLRGELGFSGVALSDAIEMAGSVARVSSAYDLIVGLVNSGSDMLLFSNAARDYALILRGVKEGRIPAARVAEAAGRVLALKEALGFAADPESALPARELRGAGTSPSGAANSPPTAAEEDRFRQAARTIARRALTVVRDAKAALPLGLSSGDRVLVVHLRSNPEFHADGFDALLAERGFAVERRSEADDPYWFRAQDYSRFKAVLLVFVQGPTWGTSGIRPNGPYMRGPWFIVHECPACPIVGVSFGSPYLADEFPWVPAWLNAYSPDPESIRAAVDALTDELAPIGVSPVDLDRPARLRAATARFLAAEAR